MIIIVAILFLVAYLFGRARGRDEGYIKGSIDQFNLDWPKRQSGEPFGTLHEDDPL